MRVGNIISGVFRRATADVPIKGTTVTLFPSPHLHVVSVAGRRCQFDRPRGAGVSAGTLGCITRYRVRELLKH